jgi:hypothetical protein
MLRKQFQRHQQSSGKLMNFDLGKNIATTRIHINTPKKV